MNTSLMNTPRAPRRSLVERLETRQLLSAAVGTTLQNTVGSPGGPATVIDLAGAFDDTAVIGSVVRLTTSLGNIDIELFDQSAKRTAQNFANYVANGLYNNTVIHRSDPDFIVQGGGYFANAQRIQRGQAIQNEYSNARPNVRGAIAMAKLPAFDSLGNPVPGGGPDSATSEWFINIGDNSQTLGPQQNGGFTVFGQVINNTMATVDAIAALQVFDATVVSPVFSELPVRNNPGEGNFPAPDDFVFISNASPIAETRLMNLTATSDNPDVVGATLNPDGTLSLSYGATTGSARITVTATASDGSQASQTFIAGNGELTVQIGAGGVGNSINFLEADGGAGSVTITKKAGSALIRVTGSGLAIAPGKKPGIAGTVTAIAGIDTLDTGTRTAIAIKTAGGDGAIDVGSITTTTPLKSLTMATTRLTGALTIGGTLKTLQLGNVTNSTITVGGSPADRVAMVLSLGAATDVHLTSGVPIKKLTAGSFNSTGLLPGALTAPAVTTVTVRGDFQESLITQAPIKSMKIGGNQKGNISGVSLGNLTAASLQGGVFNFTGGGKTVGKVAVAGSITNTTLRAAGDVLRVTATEWLGGRLYAGANVPDEEFPPFLPTSGAQFVTPARIGQVLVTTKTEGLSIAAASLGKLQLGEVGTDGPVPFGIAALTITALSGQTATVEDLVGKPFSFTRLDGQAEFDAAAAAQGLDFGNFSVVLF